MYAGSITASATYPPSVNVRKGLLPQNKNNPNWCSVVTPSPYYTTLPTYAKPIPSTSGNTTATGNNTTKSTITNVPTADIPYVFANQMITGSTIAVKTTVNPTNSTTTSPIEAFVRGRLRARVQIDTALLVTRPRAAAV
jgi:hypothetical protein